MRSMAIYQDKLFVATTDARLVGARCAHRQAGLGRRRRRSEKGFTQHQRSDRHQGQGAAGAGSGATASSPDRCYISAYDAETGKQLWRFNTVAQSGERGGDTWGNVAEHVPQGRRDLDHRQLRPRSRPHLLGRGAGQAVGGGEPQHEDVGSRALHELDRRAQARHRHARVVLPAFARANRSIWTRSTSACSSTSARASSCSRSASPASCGSSIAQSGEFVSLKETVFHNVFDRIDLESGRAALPAGDHGREGGRVGGGVSEHGRRAQLARDQLSPGRGSAASFRWRSRAWRFRVARSNSRRGRAARPATASSSRCPARTATSASSRRST